MPHRLLILGSGGHGHSVADAIRAQGDDVLGFHDSRPAHELVAGIPVLGPLHLAWVIMTQPCPKGAPTPDRFVVAIGIQSCASAGTRAGGRRDSSTCSGSSPYVLESISSAGSPLRGVLVNSGAVVDHDATCDVYSQLGVNAAMVGESCLGPLASLAAGEVLGCGEHRGAELELAPSAAGLTEGVSCAGSSG